MNNREATLFLGKMRDSMIGFWAHISKISIVDSTRRLSEVTLLCETDPSQPVVTIRTNDGFALRFVDISVRPKDSQKYDAYVIFLLRFNISNAAPVLIKSNVRLIYTEARSGVAAQSTPTVVHGFHFDGEVQNAHPIFHVQLGPPGGHFTTGSFGGSVDDSLLGLRDVPIPRIPTPPMDLAAVVHMILRDHARDSLENWKDAVLQLQPYLPISGKSFQMQGVKLPRYCTNDQQTIEFWYP